MENMKGHLDVSIIHIRALRPKSRSKMCCMLNGIKILPSPNGLPRDWRGLAHLIGTEILSIGFSGINPVDKLFNIWEKDENATIGKLQYFLQEIDRFDAFDDTSQMIEDDVHLYYQMESTGFIEKPLVDVDDEKHVLTVDDVCRYRNGLHVQIYDAFVLFVDSDVEFATNLIHKLETEYSLKLCVKDRDLIGGLSFQHEAIMRLISERCNRLIVILSSDFLKSDAHKFFVNFAQAIGIEQGRRKVVPCLYKRCMLPPELSSYFLLDYSRSNPLWNFWDKLRDSVIVASITSCNETPALTFPSNNPEKIVIEEVQQLDEGECTKPLKSDFENITSLQKKNTIATLISKLSRQKPITQMFKSKNKKRASAYSL